MAIKTPSVYQQNIFSEYRKSNSNIVISAVAGSGKTTTILELLRFVPHHKRVAFLAFNKSIVEELKDRAPAGIEVSTLHSLGCKALFRHYNGKVEVNDWKSYRIAKTLSRRWRDIPPKKFDMYMYNLSRIINYYRLTLQSSHSAIENIIDFYGIDTIGNEVQHASEVLDALYEYNEDPFRHDSKFMIDFADMIYLPVTKPEIVLNKYDEVFIDETQDMNACQQQLVKRIIKNNGRFIAVGDPKQSIYGFMGADIHAYNNFKNQDNTIELPLSVCYRCGTNIVKRANTIYNNLESPDWQHEGEVIENGGFDDIQPGDIVVCRNNLPIVELYFSFIQEEIPCYIKGSDIGKGIINLVKSVQNNSSISGLIDALKARLSNIYMELVERGINEPVKHNKYVSFNEKVDIIEIFSKKYSLVETLVAAVERTFKEDGKGVVLMTIHKSKGLEADNVYFYMPSLLPSKYAVSAHELIQEKNLEYVAMTRAKKKLIIVP